MDTFLLCPKNFKDYLARFLCFHLRHMNIVFELKQVNILCYWSLGLWKQETKIDTPSMLTVKAPGILEEKLSNCKVQSRSISTSYLDRSVSALGKNMFSPGDLTFVPAMKNGSSIRAAGSKRENIVSAFALIVVCRLFRPSYPK